ncbi:MAG: NAD(P)/FAD-dependent oxidoreductase [Angelakisella sp.]
MIELVQALLAEHYGNQAVVATADERGIVTLRGQCSDWPTLVALGQAVAKVPGVRNVVSDMTAEGVTIPKKDYTPYLKSGKAKGEIANVDVVIVGAGVSGCGIARELSKYDLSILVVEMGDDVANAASKANNGDIHPGHAVKPGTLKAKLNVEGNAMYTKWAEELGFELQRCGTMKVITDMKDIGELESVLKVAQANGVPDVRIVYGEEIYEIEPKLKREMERQGKQAVAALWVPTMGIVEPYQVVVALAENAAKNGVKFLFDCTVGGVLHENGHVAGVITEKGIIKAPYVINCAGVYADELSEMAGDRCFTIHPRKGTIAILDKNAPPMYDAMGGIVTGQPVLKKNAESKGGGMCRTPERNILLGPSATEVPDKEDATTTPQDTLYAMNRNQNPYAGWGDVIRIFAGVRPADYKEDFVIGMSDITHGFVNVGGIQSPGLASAPAIAKMAVKIVVDDMSGAGKAPAEKADFDPIQPRPVEFRHMTMEERDALIAKDPRYGRIICRCEQITEGEILDAVHSLVVPTSIDAIKRRTRAGMGRCQGGFCQPRVLELLARELGKDWVDITLKGCGSYLLVSDNREVKI